MIIHSLGGNDLFDAFPNFLNIVVMMMEIFVIILFFTNSQQMVYFISVNFIFGMVGDWCLTYFL